MIDEWEIWKGVMEDEEGALDNQYSSVGVKNNWWNPLWIPITYDGAGNHYCLDLDPAPEGNYGQIIRMWHDNPERTIEANSFKDWVANYATQLKNGQLIYSIEYGGIIYKVNANRPEADDNINPNK